MRHPISRRLRGLLAAIALVASFAAQAALAPVWRNVTPGNPPAYVQDSSMTFDSTRNRAVLFNADAGIVNLSSWNGSAWTPHVAADASPGPGGRTAPITYDAAHDRIVLFGGFGFGQRKNDTWRWDGTSTHWSAPLPAMAPQARNGHAMVYDSARQRVVLTGGIYCSDGVSMFPCADTWEFDGELWTRVVVPLGYTPGRWRHGMAYDAARGVVVMFGGTNNTYTEIYDDTWEFDGNSWTKKTPANKPSARHGHTMAYDAARHKVVLYGGAGVGHGAEHWEWDGSNWTPIVQPTVNPGARQSHAMTYDSARQRLVLAGNFGGGMGRDEVWELAWEEPPPPGVTTTTLTSAPASSSYGQSVTLTATVVPIAPATATPTGTVTFFADGNVIIGCYGKPLDNSGVANCATDALAVGSHAITAQYGGNAAYPASQPASNTLSLQVDALTTTIGAGASPTSARFGETIWLVAGVAINGNPNHPAIAGTVAFFDGGTAVPGCGAVTVGVSGQAQCAVTHFAVGTHSLTAKFTPGHGNALPSTSPDAVSISVAKADTTTTLSLPSSPIVTGSFVDIGASVAVNAPGAGSPSGTIAITAPAGAGCSMSWPSQTSCSYLASSTMTLTATFTPDAASGTAFNGSAASGVLTVVETHTVTPSAGANGSISPGAPQTIVHGQTATFQVTPAPGHIAAMGGSCGGAFQPSSTTLWETGAITADCSVAATFPPRLATTVLTGSAGPITYDQSVTFTATVHPAASTHPMINDSHEPTGVVSFRADGVSIGCDSQPLNSLPPDPGNPAPRPVTATCTTRALAAGNHTISAQYGGDGNYPGPAPQPSSNELALRVDAAATHVAVDASFSGGPVSGQAVSLNAALRAGGADGPLVNGAANGAIAFLDNGVAVPGCASVAAAVGQCPNVRLAAGTHALTAVFTPADGNRQGSTSDARDLLVGKASTTLSLIAPPQPLTLGHSATIGASLAVNAPGSGAPGGTIAIGDGEGASCAIAWPAQAACSLTPVRAGTKTLTATFTPDAASGTDFDGSEGTGSLTVEAAQPGATLTSSANPSVFGQPVTLTATVTPSAGGQVPTTGNGIAFFIGGTEVCPGSTLTSVAGTASASCDVPQSVLSAGNHAATFQYAGDADNLAVDATLAGGQTVARASTTTTLDVPVTPVSFGRSISIGAGVTVVSPGSGAPGGRIVISDGSVHCTIELPGSTCDLMPASAGTKTLTATFTPDAASGAGFEGSTAHGEMSVEKAEQAPLSLATAPAVLTPGQQSRLIASGGSGDGEVTYSLDGGPCGVSGDTVLAQAVGTCAVRATKAGGANYEEASATATLNVVASQLTLTIDDGRDYVRYGQIVDTIVTLANVAGAPTAIDVPVTFALSDGFDPDFAEVTCHGTGAGATCMRSNELDPLRYRVTLPPGRELMWRIVVPVRPDAEGVSVTFSASAGGAESASDTNTLVIFKEGFDTPYGDGTQAVDDAEGG